MSMEKELGKRLVLYRRERGLTQKDMADKIGISYQAISKWENGKSVPSVEMICKISEILNVPIDILINSKRYEGKSITYMDAGIDTRKLYRLKKNLMSFVSNHENIISAQYASPVIFRMDVLALNNPICSLVSCIPGTKEKMGLQHGFYKEICKDVVACSINQILQYGMKPILLQGRALCGVCNDNLLLGIAEELKTACVSKNIMFAGLEVSTQPMNYARDECNINVNLVGIQEQDKVITGKKIKHGDIVIGIETKGVEGSCFPIINALLEQNPDLINEKIDSRCYFIEKIMSDNTIYIETINELLDLGLIHGIYKTRNSLLNQETYYSLPSDLGICIDLNQIPIEPLYEFMHSRNLIAEERWPYSFNFGIGMLVVVSKQKVKSALNIIQKFHRCWVIGKVERLNSGRITNVWTEGKIQW